MFLGFYLLIEIRAGIRSHIFGMGKVSPLSTNDLLRDTGSQPHWGINVSFCQLVGHSELLIEGEVPLASLFCVSLKTH